MHTIHRTTLIGLSALTIVAASATGNAFSREQADQAAPPVAASSTATPATADALQAPRPTSRSRAEVKAEAVKANKEHRTTLSESMDLVKKTDVKEGDKAAGSKKKNRN